MSGLTPEQQAEYERRSASVKTIVCSGHGLLFAFCPECNTMYVHTGGEYLLCSCKGIGEPRVECKREFAQRIVDMRTGQEL